MDLRDFKATQYTSRDGCVRVVQVGVLWYGETHQPDGRWKEVAAHCTNYVSAVLLTLERIGELEEETEDTGPDDRIDW